MDDAAFERHLADADPDELRTAVRQLSARVVELTKTLRQARYDAYCAGFDKARREGRLNVTAAAPAARYVRYATEP